MNRVNPAIRKVLPRRCPTFLDVRGDEDVCTNEPIHEATALVLYSVCFALPTRRRPHFCSLIIRGHSCARFWIKIKMGHGKRNRHLRHRIQCRPNRRHDHPCSPLSQRGNRSNVFSDFCANILRPRVQSDYLETTDIRSVPRNVQPVDVFELITISPPSSNTNNVYATAPCGYVIPATSML